VAYATEFSPILGYQTGLMYWSANWVGNLAIAVTGVAYLSIFFPILKSPVHAGLISIGVVWLFTLLNLCGAARMARLVSISVILLLIPVVGTGVFGWHYFSYQQFWCN